MSRDTTPAVTLALIQHLLSLHTTHEISNHLATTAPNIPNSLLTSCITYLVKNAIIDAQKLLIFANIVLKVHDEAMRLGYGVVNVYENLKVQLLKYTVNAPPYSVELFTLNDFKVMSIWICEIYLKHYKMWLYRDSRKEVVNVAVLPVDDFSKGNLLSGLQDLRPLGESLPEDKWMEKHQADEEERKKQQEADEEKRRQEEAERAEEEPAEAEETQEEETLAKAAHHDIPEREEEPDIKNAYIKRQLEEIKNMLLQFSDEKMGSVEERLKNIETVVQQQEEAAAQAATKGKKK